MCNRHADNFIFLFFVWNKKNINFVEDQSVSIYTQFYFNFISGGFKEDWNKKNYGRISPQRYDNNDDRRKTMTKTHMTLFITWPKECDPNNYTSTWILRTKQKNLISIIISTWILRTKQKNLIPIIINTWILRTKQKNLIPIIINTWILRTKQKNLIPLIINTWILRTKQKNLILIIINTWILRTKQTFSRSPVPLSLPMILIWSTYAGSLCLYFSTLYSPVWMFK